MRRLPHSNRSTNRRGAVVLPPANVGRWVASRKAQVVAAILTGEITVEGACARYALGEDELQQWIAAFRDVGENGLRSRRQRHEYRMRYQHRFEVAPEGKTWMVVDLETRRTAIAEDIALNGLMLREAVALAEALNFLHRRLWRAVRH